MIRSAKFSLLLIAFTLFTLPVFADILLDGSFEPSTGPDAIATVTSSDSCGGYAYAICYNVGDNIGHWTVVGLSDPNTAPIMLMSTNYAEPIGGVPGNPTLSFNVQNGSQAIDLTGAGNQIAGIDGIKQSLNLNAGTYDLSFWLGRQDTSAPGYLGTAATAPASLIVEVGGPGHMATPVCTPFNNYVGGSDNVSWQQFNCDFSASGYTTIAFLNNTELGNNYAGLDNVVLTQTPEPASLLLLGSGLIGLFGWKSRKAR